MNNFQKLLLNDFHRWRLLDDIDERLTLSVFFAQNERGMRTFVCLKNYTTTFDKMWHGGGGHNDGCRI